MIDLKGIERKALARRRYCAKCEDAGVVHVAVVRCIGGGDCNTERCEAHKEFCDGGCTHTWVPNDEGLIEDVLSLTARVRELEAELASWSAVAPTADR